MTSRIPTDNERRLHIAIIATAAIVAAGMVGAAVWAVTRPAPPRVLPTVAYTPARETSASASATTNPSGVASPAVETTTQAPAAASNATNDDSNSSQVVSAHKIAYRVGSALYVAKENGTGARLAYGQSDDYALSPDGTRIASIVSGKLAVVVVGARPASKADLSPATSAEAVTPVWMPDSSAVLFVRTDSSSRPSIWRYTLANQNLEKLGAGSGVVVSPDGQTTIGLPPEGTDSQPLTVWRSDGRVYTVQTPSGDPVAVALSDDHIYITATSASSAASSLWSMTLEGKSRKQLVGASSAGSTSATYGELLVSPDGKHLMYTVEGDDGYSRIRIVSSTGGSSVAISGRRDGYPLGWTADSKHVLFVEGNAYQGQTTGLWRSDLAGTQRVELVKGATI